MREEHRGVLSSIVQAVNVGDCHLDSSSSVMPSRHPTLTPYIFPIGVSLPHRTHGYRNACKEVLVLLCVEEVLSHLPFPRQQAKAFRLCNSYPEAVSPADRAVAPIGTCGKIEISLEPHCSTMATTAVKLQHTAPRV
jgi:hypothetical protein